MVGRQRANLAGSERSSLPELTEFDQILATARRHNVIRLKFGEVEAVFGPPEPKEDPKGASPEARWRKAKRDHYEILLNHPVSDEELEKLPDHF